MAIEGQLLRVTETKGAAGAKLNNLYPNPVLIQPKFDGIYFKTAYISHKPSNT